MQLGTRNPDLAAAAIFGGGPRSVNEYGDLISVGRDYAIAGIGALSGGTISVLIVQEAALGVGLTTVAAFPVLGAQELPPGLFGIFLLAMLATVMSTVDSYAFIAAATFGNDIMRRFGLIGADHEVVQRRRLLWLQVQQHLAHASGPR